MKNDVTVVIMAHNRVETIGEAIDSVLLQKDVKIVVSDNSSSDCVKNFVALNYPTIHYFQRKNYPDSSSHFNAILTSINSKYFMIFHDYSRFFTIFSRFFTIIHDFSRFFTIFS